MFEFSQPKLIGDEWNARRDSAFGSRGDSGGEDCDARMGELERGDECAGLCDVVVVKSKLKMGRFGEVGAMVLSILSTLIDVQQGKETRQGRDGKGHNSYCRILKGVANDLTMADWGRRLVKNRRRARGTIERVKRERVPVWAISV